MLPDTKKTQNQKEFQSLCIKFWSAVLPVCVVARVFPIYLHSSNVVMSLLRLRLVCFDLVGSQKNQDR